jgi:molybdopterin converting factor small subunit
MNTIIKLDHAFKPFAGNHATVAVQGDTVKECLDNLIGLYPIFKEILFDVEGTLAALVMVEGEAVVPKDLDRPVSSQKEIILLPMIQGG